MNESETWTDHDCANIAVVPKSAEDITETWEEEILSPIKAVDDGTAVGVPYDEVMSSAESVLCQSRSRLEEFPG